MMVRFDLMCLPEYQLACKIQNPERARRGFVAQWLNLNLRVA